MLSRPIDCDVESYFGLVPDSKSRSEHIIKIPLPNFRLKAVSETASSRMPTNTTAGIDSMKNSIPNIIRMMAFCLSLFSATVELAAQQHFTSSASIDVYQAGVRGFGTTNLTLPTSPRRFIEFNVYWTPTGAELNGKTEGGFTTTWTGGIDYVGVATQTATNELTYHVDMRIVSPGVVLIMVAWQSSDGATGNIVKGTIPICTICKDEPGIALPIAKGEMTFRSLSTPVIPLTSKELTSSFRSETVGPITSGSWVPQIFWGQYSYQDGDKFVTVAYQYVAYVWVSNYSTSRMSR